MFSIEIHTQHQLAVIRFYGTVTQAEAAECMQAFVAQPGYAPTLRGLVDLRKAEVEVAAEETRGLARQSLEQGVSRAPWVFLAETPINTALAMLYIDVLTSAHDSRICSTVEAASDYLGVDVAPLLKRLETKPSAG